MPIASHLLKRFLNDFAILADNVFLFKGCLKRRPATQRECGPGGHHLFQQPQFREVNAVRIVATLMSSKFSISSELLSTENALFFVRMILLGIRTYPKFNPFHLWNRHGRCRLGLSRVLGNHNQRLTLVKNVHLHFDTHVPNMQIFVLWIVSNSKITEVHSFHAHSTLQK